MKKKYILIEEQFCNLDHIYDFLIYNFFLIKSSFKSQYQYLRHLHYNPTI